MFSARINLPVGKVRTLSKFPAVVPRVFDVIFKAAQLAQVARR